MADFLEDARRILEGAKGPGAMYPGWNSDPTSRDKGGAVYRTPFDRQGGDLVAQRQLDEQLTDIAAKYQAAGVDFETAVRQAIDGIKNQGRSPADRGQPNAAPFTAETAYNYGSELSANAQVMNEFQAFLSAKREKEEEDKKREEERKRREEGEKKEKDEEEKAMSLFAKFAPALSSFIQAEVGKALSGNAQAPAPAQAQVSAPTQAQMQSGLSAYGQQPVLNGGAWRDLPGVQAPQNMQVGSMHALSGVPNNPNQEKADRFMREASNQINQCKDRGQQAALAEGAQLAYASILSGFSPTINDELLKYAAEKAGVQFSDYGFAGGVRV